MLTLGIIADTHVPDRADQINTRVITVLKAARVAAVLHAGDICTPEVLEQLSEIAPVHAVQGNRDVWRLSHLPMRLLLEFGGVSIGLTHGHGSLASYFTQKLSFLIDGYQFSKYQQSLKGLFPTANVIVFGHTHRSENTWAGDTLIFNPGPASKFRWSLFPAKTGPSMGLLYIQSGDRISAEILPLD
jgi:putative phosphoesterase